MRGEPRPGKFVREVGQAMGSIMLIELLMRAAVIGAFALLIFLGNIYFDGRATP